MDFFTEEPPKLDLKKNRIRSFFLSFDVEKKPTNEQEEIKKETIKNGLVYLQMKLPIVKITHDYESKLKEKLEKNIVRANIREAKNEDLAKIMYIHNRSFMTSGENFMPITLEALQDIFNLPDIKIFIAKVYGTDAGFIMLDFEGSRKEYGVIAGLSILPEYQRKGLGTILGIAAWNYLKQKKVKELRCEVFANNKVSYCFIKNLGFEEYETKVYKTTDFLLNPNKSNA